jgi:hypothetical protein
MKGLFLTLLLISTIYAAYPFSLPTFTLNKECESVTQEDFTITCPVGNNHYAYVKNFRIFGYPNGFCEITMICDRFGNYRLDKYVEIQVLPNTY